MRVWVSLSICLGLETRLLYASFGGICLLKLEAILNDSDELKPVVVENQQKVTVEKRLMVREAKL